MGFIFLVVRIVGGRGQKYYRAQQTDLAAVNGYAEEYIEGQKVVKVFSHEAEVKKQFDVLSRDLFDSGSESQSFSLMVMPILANASYVHYALTAMAGAVLDSWDDGYRDDRVVSSVYAELHHADQ